MHWPVHAGGDEGEHLGSTALISARLVPLGMRKKTEEPGSQAVQFRHVNSWVCRVINNYRSVCVYETFTCKR